MENKRVFYGRFQGRGLGPYKTNLVDKVLPQVRIDLEPDCYNKPQDFFKNSLSASDYYGLEIGFGTGDHLAAMAEGHRDRRYIGCEVYLNGIAALLEHIDKKSLQDNVRIFPWVIQDLVSALEYQSINDVYIMFPDPWPKAKHGERRLVSADFLHKLSRIVKPQGFVHIASDDQAYIQFCLKSIEQSHDFTLVDKAQQKPSQWTVMTSRYEQKALKSSHPCTYLTLRRKDSMAWVL